MFTPSGSDYAVYLLYKPKVQGQDFILLACDLDRDKRDDRIFSCALADIIKLNNLDNVHLINMSVTPSGVYCSSQVQQIDRLDSCVDIALPSQSTLWDVFELLAADGSQMNIEGEWIPVSRLSFSMKANRVTYTNYQRHTITIWTEDTITEPVCKTLRIKCTIGRYNWLVNTFESAVKVNIRDHSSVECILDLGSIPSAYNNSYVLKRFCLAELVYLMNRYQTLRAKLHGMELGNWFMHHEVGDDYSIYSHIKPQSIEQQGTVSFDYQIVFPDALQFKSNLLADCKALDKLFAAQNNDDFLDILLQYAGKSSEKNIYFEQFAKGFMSQLSENSLLRDHELLCIEDLQQRLASYAARIFSYKIAMLTVPLNIPERIDLLSGSVIVRRKLL